MQPHQQRVVAEKAELDEKIAGLRTFIAGNIYESLTVGERTRLVRQLAHMTAYSNVLGERIAAFVPEPDLFTTHIEALAPAIDTFTAPTTLPADGSGANTYKLLDQA